MLRSYLRSRLHAIRLSFTAAVVISLFVSAIMLAGCNVQRTGEERSRPYPNDGYLGLSQSNPNLQTSPTHYTYAKDVRLVREALNEWPQVRNAIVWIHGGTLHVRLQFDDGLVDEQEIDRLEQEALEKLEYTFPRYEVKVTSNPDS